MAGLASRHRGSSWPGAENSHRCAGKVRFNVQHSHRSGWRVLPSIRAHTERGGRLILVNAMGPYRTADVAPPARLFGRCTRCWSLQNSAQEFSGTVPCAEAVRVHTLDVTATEFLDTRLRCDPQGSRRPAPNHVAQGGRDGTRLGVQIPAQRIGPPIPQHLDDTRISRGQPNVL